MNKTAPEEVERAVWEDIARTLEREGQVERCLCFNERFFSYLCSAPLSFPLENYPGSERGAGTADLFLGWQVLGGDFPALDPGEIYSSLRPGGEARIFGFYRFPSAGDIREWESRAAVAATLRFPLPGAGSLGAVAGWLKTGAFNRYTLRKRGIYYDCRLSKDA